MARHSFWYLVSAKKPHPIRNLIISLIELKNYLINLMIYSEMGTAVL